MLYHRDYFVFPRHKSSRMDDRIYSITGLMGHEQRFCDSAQKQKLAYINGCPKGNVTATAAAFEQLRLSSERYLQRCLQIAKERINNNEA